MDTRVSLKQALKSLGFQGGDVYKRQAVFSGILRKTGLNLKHRGDFIRHLANRIAEAVYVRDHEIIFLSLIHI